MCVLIMVLLGVMMVWYWSDEQTPEVHEEEKRDVSDYLTFGLIDVIV